MAKSKGKTASQIVSESRQELVDQLIQKMKDGVSPVREMWDSVSTYGLPNNPISGARYQGVNLLRLLIASAVGKYEDSRWMTLKQANKQGYRIKKGAKSVISQGIPVEKFFELGGEIIKLDTSPNSTHVNVFEMAGIDPKKVEENTKLINDLINSMKE